MRKFLLTCVIAIFMAVTVSAQVISVSDADRKAITEAALNYMEGGDEGNVERMGKALHYELMKVTPVTLPQTGSTVLMKMGYTELLEIIRPNAGKEEKKESSTTVDILAVKEGLAMVTVVSKRFYDYLQIAEIEGEWKLVNVLWIFNPEFRKDTAAEPNDVDADKEAVKQAVLDYIDGSFSGDAVRMERALHPELTKVIPSPHPQTGKVLLRKMGAGMLIEGTKAKMGMVEEGKRDIHFKLLDIQRNIAFA